MTGGGWSGGCACGAVRYSGTGALRRPVACHCETCRRSSGHHTAATACARDALNLADARALRWWDSSPGHRRGFCAVCGSSLFWEALGSGRISIFAGSLDAPTGLAMAGHIFMGEKADYYRIVDGLPAASGCEPCLTAPAGDA